MIDALDKILADLVQSRIPTVAGVTQVGFDAPNGDWRTAVITASEERINLYLYDLRENLKLRSNERIRERCEGVIFERPYPPMLNCMYLATAWSPVAAQPPLTDPAPDEHLLLFALSQLFLRRRSIVVRDVYEAGLTIPSGRTLASVPPELQDEELPLYVAQPDASGDMLEFWSTMAGIWRPALKIIVTLPVFLREPDFESPMVTTLVGRYRQVGIPATEETFHSIGGIAGTGTPISPVKAIVRIVGLTPPPVQVVDRRFTTGDDGRFLFSRLPAGHYRIDAVSGIGAGGARDVDVPSETGEYDLTLT